VFELVLAAAAITLVFVRGSIFAPLRSIGPHLWQELASCALCAGFWIGAILYFLHGEPAYFAFSSWLNVLGFGALTAAAALLLVRVLDALEKVAE
jgi:hypothetical protein